MLERSRYIVFQNIQFHNFHCGSTKYSDKRKQSGQTRSVLLLVTNRPFPTSKPWRNTEYRCILDIPLLQPSAEHSFPSIMIQLSVFFLVPSPSVLWIDFYCSFHGKFSLQMVRGCYTLFSTVAPPAPGACGPAPVERAIRCLEGIAHPGSRVWYNVTKMKNKAGIYDFRFDN